MNNFVKDCGIGMKVTEDEIRKIAEEEIKDATPNSNIF